MENETQQESKTEIKKSKKSSLKLLTYILVLGLGVWLGIDVARLKPEWVGLSKGAAQAQAEVDALVAKVGKLINLPTDEKPTVATVTDASKVKDQSFFANAKNDDKVLIYQKAAKAILYRPSENRIIEVGAVNINNQAAVATPTVVSAIPTPTAKAKAKATAVPVPSPVVTSQPSATP